MKPDAIDARDRRTPEELLAAGDHREPPRKDGSRRLYLPPHLKGRSKRHYLRHLLLAEAAAAPPEVLARARASFLRASGLIRCPQCGEVLYDHPPDPTEPCLTIRCDGARVKL